MDGVVRRIGARSRRGRRRGGANATAPPAGRRGCPHRSRQRVAIDALAVFDENGPPRERAVAHHRVRTHREGEHRDGPGRSRRAWRAGGSAPKRERERGVVAREGSAFRVGTSETREGKKNRREGTATVEKRFEIRDRRFRRLPRRRLAGPARRIAAAHIPPPRPAMAEACGVCAKPLAGRGAPRLTAGCCAARFHARCVSRRRVGAQVRPRPAPSAQPPPRPLRNPDPSPHSPPSRPPPQPNLPRASALVPDLRRSASRVHVGRRRRGRHPIAARPPPRAPRARRVPPPRRSRPRRRDAALCADLFDVPLHRAKLLARGGELRGEPDVAAASARGAPILFVGARRADAKALESLPRRAALILAAVARTPSRRSADARGTRSRGRRCSRPRPRRGTPGGWRRRSCGRCTRGGRIRTSVFRARPTRATAEARSIDATGGRRRDPRTPAEDRTSSGRGAISRATTVQAAKPLAFSAIERC